MEQEINQLIFNMGSLRTNVPPHPQKRGLSRYYSGKARSFTCIADVRCLEDLKKPEHSDVKKRKKHCDSKEMQHLPPYACRRAPSCTQFATPCVNA